MEISNGIGTVEGKGRDKFSFVVSTVSADGLEYYRQVSNISHTLVGN